MDFLCKEDITKEQFKIALENGINRANVINRVENLEWDIEKAITTPIRPRGNFSKLYTDDIRKKAKENNISQSTLYFRITKKGIAPENAAEKLKKKNTKDTKFQLYKGEKFICEGTAMEIAKIINVKESTVIYRAFPCYNRRIKNRVKTKWENQLRIIRVDTI